MKRKGLKIGITLLIIFALYNLVWLSNAYCTYHPFTKAIPKHESGMYALFDEETGYSYNIKFPDYFYFTGNIGVSDNNGSGLIIWPGFFGTSYEFGFQIKDESNTYYIYVDKNMIPIDLNEETGKIYEDHKEEMEQLWDAAQGKLFIS